MNAALSAVMISGFRSETITVEGGRLHYRIGGDPDGQPVILWHGFLSTGYAWREVAPALARAGMSVMILDMRGYGDSDKPAGDDGYNARALAEECRSLVAKMGFGGGKPIVLAAHDMGALPALICAADHAQEVAGLLYIEAPVMLGIVLRKVFDYTQDAMAQGSMWWWILPLAPGVPERLIVGNERAFLGWFYEGSHVVHHEAFSPAVVDEYLRTFSGREGVLGSMGIYRTAFISISQTEPLMARKVTVPVVALDGEKGLGAKVGEMVRMVATHVEATVRPDCGHFLPEEAPDVVTKQVLAMAARTRS
jgi:pimeloyl-ACP methyl ester carboxylesterase